MTLVRTSLLIGSIALSVVTTLPAQCNTYIAPSDGLPGINGVVHATAAWDPDGSGPLGERLVVGGLFTAAGGVSARNLAMFDPQAGTWSPLGGGCNERVYALGVLPNGHLVVGGAFTLVGSTAAAAIARWDGAAWHTFGSGMTDPVGNPHVRSLAVLPSGEVVAAGRFAQAGGVLVNGIARWTGAAWLGYSTGFGSGATPYALAALPDGSLVAAGILGTAGGTPVGRIARWDGTAWAPLGSLSSTVYCLHVTPSGTLVAGGLFIGSGLGRVAAWSGTSWTPLGSGLSGGVLSLATGPGGVLLAGGNFSNSGPARSVAAWDGTVWTGLGSGLPGNVWSLTVTSGNTVWAGGEFLAEGVDGGNNVAQWNGLAWRSCGVGIDRPVHGLLALEDGQFLMVGQFSRIGSAAFPGVARWDGSGWLPVPLPSTRVYRFFRGDSGALYAAGYVNPAGQSQLWRDQAGVWTPIGGVLTGTFSSVNERPDGSIVVGGSFYEQGLARIARWDGVAWQAMGSGFDGFVNALATLPDGSLVAGGDFYTAGGVLTRSAARWNGSAWVAMPGLPGSVQVMLVHPDGRLIAAGDGVRYWDGTSWQTLGSVISGELRALCVLPNGDLIAGGGFTLPGSRLARWNGTAWLPMPPIEDRNVNTLEVLPDGTLLVGGDFGLAGGVATGPFVRIPTTCPATVTVYGAGCASSAGPSVLVSQRRPWLGSTFEASATGVPPAAIGVTVFGFQTASLPLANLLPGGVAGCSLLAAPDSLSLALPVNGSVATALAIPSSSGLVGLMIAHQVVLVELDPAGNLGPVTSTNGLMLRIGSL